MQRVTLRDVAGAAGVSRTTASNVVMGKGRVSDETRARVLRVMTELGYVYNQTAGALRRQQTRSVGVVVTNIHRPHFGELLIGIESTLTENGFTALVVSSMDRLDQQRRAFEALREHDVAGVVMIPATGSGDELLGELRAWGSPSMFVSRYIRGRSHPYVGTDDIYGAGLAGEHLVGLGCERIAYLGGNPVVASRIDRIEGLRQAIAAAGRSIDFFDLVGEPTGAGGMELGRQILALSQMPDGVLCHGDATAIGLLRALHDAGRTDAVRVVGYDGISLTRYVVPSLTTVATDGFALGRAAASSLIRAIETGAPAQSVLMRPRLVVRESSGPHR